MATDYWPQEEGCVFDSGAYVLPCRPDGAISELACVAIGTTVAGRISVITVGAESGTGIGVALRASTGAGVPERIPVLFYGIVKMTGCATAGYYMIAGSFCISNGPSVVETEAAVAFATQKVGGGASYILGLVVSGPITGEAAAGDECLVLVGKTA